MSRTRNVLLLLCLTILVMSSAVFAADPSGFPRDQPDRQHADWACGNAQQLQ